MTNFRALVASDWNECLAPCRPFDVIGHVYPDLQPELTDIFRAYTGNRIRLGTAAARIQALLPADISPAQMDDYLDRAFDTYAGVAGLIRWCRRNAVAFMINTTGMIGYFQRVWAGRRLPPVDVLSAHPMIRYRTGARDPAAVYELAETEDKGTNTARAARRLGIAPQKTILLGDSGGDGPHFEWGAARGALLVGSMTKPSLEAYCRERGIVIDRHFGRTDAGRPDPDADFTKLIPFIEAFLH